MKAIHGPVSIESTGAFLLVNKAGDYLSLPPSSNFQGLYQLEKNNEWNYYKIIDNMFLETLPIEIKNHLFYIERMYEQGVEQLYFLDHGLVYDIKDYHGKLVIDFDCRPMYDQRSWGRKYHVARDGNLIVVTYTMESDAKLEKQKVIIIKGLPNPGLIDQWVEKKYPYDEARGTNADYWVYRGLQASLEGDAHILISYGNTRHQAIQNLASLEARKKHLFHLEHSYVKHLYQQVPHKVPPLVEQGYLCALKSLENLIFNLPGKDKGTTGIFAGLPWFHHYWARDELISLKALLQAQKFGLVKLILFKHLNNIDKGRIPNRTPFANLGTADGIGWLFKRIGDFLSLLKKHKEYLSDKEIRFMAEKAEETVWYIREHYLHDGLVWNKAKETWMDTDNGDDTRKGMRLEINALYCNMINVAVRLKKLTKQHAGKLKKLERAMVKNVRKAFFHKNCLWDGYQDPTIRPNVFIAYYIFAPLLTKKEWANVFQTALDALWLEWGGLASIDKKHSLFQPVYTGQNNASYHRGDSWFWVNNIAALAMHQVDTKKFWKYLSKILDASLHDVLANGFIGHASEISSAQKQDASGTWCQSWSNATLLELIKQIYS